MPKARKRKTAKRRKKTNQIPLEILESRYKVLGRLIRKRGGSA